MEKRYQVFVSSTFEDLKDERQEVMQALLELDCIPAGMELFPAANEDQWTLIKRVIDDCDYYIVVVGGRYGSLGPGGISYTEMEYRYALERGKPAIGFLHKDPGTLTAKRTEKSDEGKVKLEIFRELVQGKVVKYWTTPADLGSVVSRSLIMLTKQFPATGWVRADKLLDEGGLEEMLRLRQQVDELQDKLARTRTSAPEGTSSLAQGDDSITIGCTFKATERGKSVLHAVSYTGSLDVTWNEIFAAVSPLMMDEASERDLKTGVNGLLTTKGTTEFGAEKGLKDMSLSGFSVKEDDFQTIKVQLRALGLMSPSKKHRSVKDKAAYWTLTPYGEEVMTRLRAIRRAE